MSVLITAKPPCIFHGTSIHLQIFMIGMMNVDLLRTWSLVLILTLAVSKVRLECTDGDVFMATCTHLRSRSKLICNFFLSSFLLYMKLTMKFQSGQN